MTLFWLPSILSSSPRRENGVWQAASSSDNDKPYASQMSEHRDCLEIFETVRDIGDFDAYLRYSINESGCRGLTVLLVSLTVLRYWLIYTPLYPIPAHFVGGEWVKWSWRFNC